MGAVLCTLMFAVGLRAMMTGVRLYALQKRCGWETLGGKLGIAGGALACMLALYLILFEL